MRLANLDAFIDAATGLLSAYPSATLSVTYSPKGKSTKIEKTPTIACKVYEPRSGKCIKFKTTKTKELSRVLVFLGPLGISTGGTRKAGVASIMSNEKFEVEEKKIEDDKKKKKKGKK